MMIRCWPLLITLLLLIPLLAQAQNALERFPKGDADTLFEASVDKEGMSDLNAAFALLWLNRDLPESVSPQPPRNPSEESPFPDKQLLYDIVYEQEDYPFLKHR